MVTSSCFLFELLWDNKSFGDQIILYQQYPIVKIRSNNVEMFSVILVASFNIAVRLYNKQNSQ